MDQLRCIRLDGIQAPPGTPIVFEGSEVGHVVKNNELGYAECAINSDIVNQLLRANKASFSLEVVKK